MNVSIDYEALMRLRAAAAGARGALSALHHLQPSLASKTVQDTIADLERALEDARDYEPITE